ncbi:DUF3325 domain-containing protein [Polaromonas sp. UC242_47]|uniref:DUF3325 domain-containing protein n=1 Tax=Polaromonas sp. UC242_47 TaxID=3374626 RepID=UPI0037B59338
MREPMLMLAACLLALWGFSLLALSQERHLERVFGSNDYPALKLRAQRAISFIAISLSLIACIAAQGASFGILLWVLLVCAAAMAIALTLTWRPQWLRRLPCPGRPRWC